MFSNIIEKPIIVNNPVLLKGQVTLCLRLLGDNNPYVIEAQQAVVKYGQTNGRLNKSELLEIWKDIDFSFASKCLVTLWWGHPNYRVAARAYSQDNLDKLSAGRRVPFKRYRCFLLHKVFSLLFRIAFTKVKS